MRLETRSESSSVAGWQIAGARRRPMRARGGRAGQWRARGAGMLFLRLRPCRRRVSTRVTARLNHFGNSSITDALHAAPLPAGGGVAHTLAAAPLRKACGLPQMQSRRPALTCCLVRVTAPTGSALPATSTNAFPDQAQSVRTYSARDVTV